MKQTIYLVGGRASGKTSLGKLLARAGGLAFVDTDRLVEQETGCSIARYVADHGWEAFRDAESRALASVAEGETAVVATGGGMVLRRENRLRMKDGIVLYLRAEPDVMAGRLQQDPNEAQRPSLTGKSIVEEMRQIMAEREPLYEEVAQVVLDASLPLSELLEVARQEVARLSAEEQGTGGAG